MASTSGISEVPLSLCDFVSQLVFGCARGRCGTALDAVGLGEPQGAVQPRGGRGAVENQHLLKEETNRPC